MSPVAAYTWIILAEINISFERRARDVANSTLHILRPMTLRNVVSIALSITSEHRVANTRCKNSDNVSVYRIQLITFDCNIREYTVYCLLRQLNLWVFMMSDKCIDLTCTYVYKLYIEWYTLLSYSYYSLSKSFLRFITNIQIWNR